VDIAARHHGVDRPEKSVINRMSGVERCEGGPRGNAMAPLKRLWLTEAVKICGAHAF
jgi:hypothetical protein